MNFQLGWNISETKLFCDWRLFNSAADQMWNDDYELLIWKHRRRCTYFKELHSHWIKAKIATARAAFNSFHQQIEIKGTANVINLVHSFV